ncbi:MAG: DoxX family protein [Actinomycetota bacterium]|nr:DoxX family protein [Actinomycetota bacterium]
MAPLFVLAVGFAVLRGLGLAGVEALDTWQLPLRGGLAAMLLLTASAHFGSRRRDLVAMVPPRLPRPELLVTITGILELAVAAAVLFDATAPWAGALFAGLLVAMFPANVRASSGKFSIGGRPATPVGPRAAIQLVFLAAAIAVGL